MKYKEKCNQMEKTIANLKSNGASETVKSEISKLREENNKFKMMLYRMKNNSDNKSQRRTQIYLPSVNDRTIQDAFLRTSDGHRPSNDITTVSNRQGMKQQKTLFHNDDIDRPLVMMSSPISRR